MAEVGESLLAKLKQSGIETVMGNAAQPEIFGATNPSRARHLVIAIPEALHVNINRLKLHGSITVGEITDLPEGAKLVTDAKTVAVHCVEPTPEVEEEAAGAAEPELIGRKAEDEEEGEKEK